MSFKINTIIRTHETNKLQEEKNGGRNSTPD